jgi:parallel beta-helix repeat protein
LVISGAKNQIINNYFYSDDSTCISFQGNTNIISNNTIDSCGSAVADSAAISTLYNGIAVCGFNVIEGNTITSCKYGITIRKSNGGDQAYRFQNTISGNSIYGCQRGGIWLQDSYLNTVTGNILNDNCNETNDTYSEILLENSEYTSIADNSVLAAASGNVAKYGIRIDANSTYNTITHNHVYNAVTTLVSDAGSNNLVKGNNAAAY